MGACSTQPKAPLPTQAASAPGPPRHIGRPYDIDTRQSALSILVYRGGPLASAGHNHVVALHELSGTVYVNAELTHSSCALHVPVGAFTVDEPQLRQAAGADFAAAVPDSAREGTRRNLLSPAVLDAEAHPAIDLECLAFATDSAGLRVQLEIAIRGQLHQVWVPLHYELKDQQLSADGELALRQSELGLTPFSVMLGALQVQDQLTIRFRLVARAT